MMNLLLADTLDQLFTRWYYWAGIGVLVLVVIILLIVRRKQMS